MISTYSWPPFSVTASNPSTGLPGGTPPTQATYIAGLDQNGDLTPVAVDDLGNVQVDIVTQSLPTGAATEAKQDAGNASLVSIDAKAPSLVSGRVPVDGSGVTQPVSASALPLPSGAATSANQSTANASLASIDTKLTSPLTVTGALTDTQLRATPVPVSGTVAVTGTFFQATQPVSAASLPLPTGAATETTLGSLNSKVTAVNTGAVVVSSSALPTGASSESTLSALNAKVTAVNTGAVVVSSSALPTGAASETTLSALNTKTPSLGQATMANSTPVVIASNQAAIPVTLSGTSNQTWLAKARIDYSSTPVTTAAYTTLISSVGSTDVKELEIFDSSGETLLIAVGAAASEVDKNYIMPGGNGRITLTITSGTRVSVKAVSATAGAGYINVNFYG